MNTLFDLTDRVAVVSGAGGGLGTAICEGLAAHGADLAMIDIDGDALAAAAQGVEGQGRRALTLTCDASDEHTVEDVFSRVAKTFGRLDILINLAYTPTFGKPEELSLADWEKALRINLTSYFLCCREAGRQMIAQGHGGAIMNMCSIGGSSAVGRGNYPYSISKGGIVMMTKELSLEWARYNIRVERDPALPVHDPGPALPARQPRARPADPREVPLRHSAQPYRRAGGDGRPCAVPRLRRRLHGHRGDSPRRRRQPCHECRWHEGLMSQT